ncbi:MAG: ABC transporter ATP-binding protein [Thermostichales cyanobacterium BF3_bins_165]
MTADLRLHQVSKRFGPTLALDQITLTVSAGSLTAILGPSGSGKSTLLHLIAGIITPDQGNIALGDRSLIGVPMHRRQVGLVPQNRLLFPHLSVGENVAFGLKMRGVSRPDREALAEQMLEQVQLKGFAQRHPRSLSGGQAQRVALARALVVRPRVLLLDEPLSALDTHLRQDMQDLIRTLQAETQTTMLLVTHDHQEAISLADQLTLLHQGQILQQGSPVDLFQRPRRCAVARFLGGVNFFPAQAEGERVWIQGIPLTLKTAYSGAGWVTIRPELVRVWERPPDRVNVVPVSLEQCRSRGWQWQLQLRHSSGLVIQAWVQQPPGQSQLWVECPPEHLWMMPD